MKTIHAILLVILLAFVSAAPEQAAASPAAPAFGPAVSATPASEGNLACIAACYAAYQAGLAGCDATCPDICTLHIVVIGCVQWERDDACHELCAEGHAAQLRSCLEDCDAGPSTGN